MEIWSSLGVPESARDDAHWRAVGALEMGGQQLFVPGDLQESFAEAAGMVLVFHGLTFGSGWTIWQ